jgi:hypothetical protein
MQTMTPHQVIVIGAGPAGMLAAGVAAQAGARTLLLEKMPQPGRKLFLSGKGRCNLTNTAPLEEFLPHFGKNGLFLRQAFHRFFAPDLLNFFASLGVPTITERGGRVFPASENARDVVDALAHWNRRTGVEIKTGAPVTQLLLEAGRVLGVTTPQAAYHAPAVIIATGGASYPGTGSTGDGYRLAQSAGHTIMPVRPALVPLVTRGDLAARLQGLSLRNVNVTLWIAGKQADQAFGEMLFTHFGLSGPLILTLSRQAVDALENRQKVIASIDLKPALDDQKLDSRLLREFDAHGKRQFQTVLKSLLPQKLIPVCCDLTGIPAERLPHQITAAERARLRSWLKDFQLEVIGHRSFRQAIVTAGGVSLREVEPRSMASRLVEGLFFAGEVLDLDADTGGFNLQAAFSTGWVAGHAAAEMVLLQRAENT